MTDTRWEECKQDIKFDKWPDNKTVDLVIDRLKEKGWKLSYPDNWPGLCLNCRSYIEEGTYHVGNQWGICEIVKRPPRGYGTTKLC